MFTPRPCSDLETWPMGNLSGTFCLPCLAAPCVQGPSGSGQHAGQHYFSEQGQPGGYPTSPGQHQGQQPPQNNTAWAYGGHPPANQHLSQTQGHTPHGQYPSQMAAGDHGQQTSHQYGGPFAYQGQSTPGAIQIQYALVTATLMVPDLVVVVSFWLLYPIQQHIQRTRATIVVTRKLN